MQKRLLLIAFHFPPLQGSTGVHRSLAFARYLGQHGWDVTVLTVTPSAFPLQSVDNNQLIPEGIRVVRARGFDAQRHLSIFGRYPRALATPDRWSSWIHTGVHAGRKLLREWSPHVIFSTFPIASAHEIGWRLSRNSGLPWVADFRDPMGQDSYPDDPRIRNAYWSLERRVLERCSAITVTTEGTAGLYRTRYPEFAAERVRVIPNGFDEAAFPCSPDVSKAGRPRSGPCVFLHSGNLYPHERNPERFFQAVAELRAQGQIASETVRFDLRGGGHSDRYQPQLDRLGIADLVRLLPGMPYRDAIAEMRDADVLMLFQAANCNRQIPAKLYEYLYVGRPVVGFTDPAGDTGRLLGELGIGAIAPLDDVDAIKTVILGALRSAADGTAFVPSREAVMRFSRAGTTKLLANLLDEVASGSGTTQEKGAARL